MGWAERLNPRSEWNKKRVMNMSSNVASPISNNPINQVSTPVQRDEPMVIEITPWSLFRSIKEFLCRMLKPSTPHQSQSPAPTS